MTETTATCGVQGLGGQQQPPLLGASCTKKNSFDSDEDILRPDVVQVKATTTNPTPNPGLITNSILFHRLLGIKDHCKKVGIKTDTPSRCAPVVLDHVLGPPLLARHTWLCPCISAVPEAVYEARVMALEGRLVSSSKKPYKLLGWTRGLRYYRIGIETSILLDKSIESVSYQYRNSWAGKYRKSIGIDFSKRKVSVLLTVSPISSKRIKVSTTQPLLNLKMPLKWQFSLLLIKNCYF